MTKETLIPFLNKRGVLIGYSQDNKRDIVYVVFQVVIKNKLVI